MTPMTPKSRHLDVMLDTRLESVDVAEHLAIRAAEEAGFAEDDVHKIGMAVREGVINAYNYGNCHDCQKKIQLTIELDGGKMVVHVLDEGCGFDLEDVADPLAEENLLRTSGRGLFLMRAFMDDLTVLRRPRGGADLVLSKNLPNHRASR